MRCVSGRVYLDTGGEHLHGDGLLVERRSLTMDGQEVLGVCVPPPRVPVSRMYVLRSSSGGGRSTRRHTDTTQYAHSRRWCRCAVSSNLGCPLRLECCWGTY
jgi:hypothetical protein